MRNPLFPLLVLSVCASLTTACNDTQKPRNAELVMSQHAIINGTLDTSESHNGVVGLYYGLNDDTLNDCPSEFLFCTGTLIHPQWVLTAAHCVTNIDELSGIVTANACNKHIQIGIGNTVDDFEGSLFDIESPSEIYYHPNYQERALDDFYATIDSDIALIKLKTPIPESVAKPILPHPSWLNINTSSLPASMVFSGYGFDEYGNSGTKLKFTGDITRYCGSANAGDSSLGCKVGYVTYSGCHPSPLYCGYYGYLIDQTDFVLMPPGSLFYDQIEGGPCQGDSGGPALLNMGGIEYLSGITSYGDAVCGVYGLSTAVQDYYSWILSLAPEVADQYVEICDNDIDDDGDGKIDSDDPDCMIKEFCGDGIVNNSEQCDGAVFQDGKSSCADWNPEFTSGIVTCSSACTVDLSSCIKTMEICGNGIDDDDNGLTDCQDLACRFDEACLPKPPVELCGNGIDDDKNGLADCDDPACTEMPSCLPAQEICGNGIDDDGNGLADCSDPACSEMVFCQPVIEKCANGIDDNGNGLIDCADPDCTTDPACLPDPTTETCNNGIDDDKNGLIDCADPGCATDPACKPKPVTEICGNYIDDDLNGLMDCQDPACATEPGCLEAIQLVEICGNGIDDDENGLIDCKDPACAADADCQKYSPILEICDNGIDDNYNGLIDCQESSCADHIACNPSPNSDSSCQAAPLTSHHGSSAALFFSFLGFGFLIRRRKYNA